MYEFNPQDIAEIVQYFIRSLHSQRRAGAPVLNLTGKRKGIHGHGVCQTADFRVQSCERLLDRGKRYDTLLSDCPRLNNDFLIPFTY